MFFSLLSASNVERKRMKGPVVAVFRGLYLGAVASQGSGTMSHGAPDPVGSPPSHWASGFGFRLKFGTFVILFGKRQCTPPPKKNRHTWSACRMDVSRGGVVLLFGTLVIRPHFFFFLSVRLFCVIVVYSRKCTSIRCMLL